MRRDNAKIAKLEYSDQFLEPFSVFLHVICALHPFLLFRWLLFMSCPHTESALVSNLANTKN
jgi:hypothetical protein